MLQIPCPWCGVRDEAEFRYKGDAGVARPSLDGAADVSPADIAAFHAYVYERSNARGWHLEWWLHTAGCRQLLRVRRHTLTHVIDAVAKAGEALPPPERA
jgi:heterotetrameric sarcosine oxidase delta subunit